MTSPPGLLIHWIVQGVMQSPDGSLSSPLASNRYRAILPAQGLTAAGHEVEFIDAARWQWPPARRPSAVIVGKLLSAGSDEGFVTLSEHVRAVASAAVASGVAVIADFNDDHFQHPLLGAHWRHLSQLARLCVVGSAPMAATLRLYSDRPTAAIGDPIGSPPAPARVFRKPGGLAKLASKLNRGSGARLKLAWYGNRVNWPAMRKWADRLAPLGMEQPFVLWVVTQPTPEIEAFATQFNQRHAPAAMIDIVPWDEQTQWGVVSDSDIVLIPSDPADPRKAVKTSNRLIDAVHAGRHVIASPLPSYLPFSDFVTLTDDPLAAIRAYLDAPDVHLEKVRQGQIASKMHASVPVIAQRWLEAIAAAGSADAAAQEQAPAIAPLSTGSGLEMPPVRLNLGCGDKILEGYVNVDVVASRRGQEPDVLCDLHDLSVFASNHADEVMAIHVVEHFWRWEIEDVLREWIRVLKPGGKMVLECPNLISACEAFLRNPVAGSEPTQDGRHTMWVFYGDPAWKDPYMIHRWGYTPHSLSQMLGFVGLVNIRQEPAQFKLKEPRDMRIVGEKPGF